MVATVDGCGARKRRRSLPVVVGSIPVPSSPSELVVSMDVDSATCDATLVVLHGPFMSKVRRLHGLNLDAWKQLVASVRDGDDAGVRAVERSVGSWDVASAVGCAGRKCAIS